MRVFVKWDPLFEKIVCVHRFQNDECIECKDFDKKRKKKGSCYWIEGKWFKVRERIA